MAISTITSDSFDPAIGFGTTLPSADAKVTIANAGNQLYLKDTRAASGVTGLITSNQNGTIYYDANTNATATTGGHIWRSAGTDILTLSSTGTVNITNGMSITTTNRATATTPANIGVYTQGNYRLFNGASGAIYIHILLPARYTVTDSKMFCLEIKGYDFDGSRIMNMMIGGYVTPVSNGGPISRIATWDSASYYSPTVYYSSTYNVGVARFYMTSRYYGTFIINSISVGNGDIIAPSELRVIESASATL